MLFWVLVVHHEPRTLLSCVHDRIPSGPELEQRRRRRSPSVTAEAVVIDPRALMGAISRKIPGRGGLRPLRPLRVAPSTTSLLLGLSQWPPQLGKP